MKKKLSIIVIVSLMLCLTACGSGNANTNSESIVTEKKTVSLTNDNIKNYVNFDGSFTNGDYTMGIVNYAEATLEFQAYPVADGDFNNVEITLVGTSNEHTFTYMNDMGNYWHLSDADRDAKNIEITFTLGVDGRFSKNYSVECLNNTGKLSGNCDFRVISVSGTFEPK